jgi:hypothetical protein
MTDRELRFELLKLCYHHAKLPVEIMETVKQIEAFVKSADHGQSKGRQGKTPPDGRKDDKNLDCA